MKNMSVEEIKAMVGTEFTYTDGESELPAIVAAFDEKVGFTCLATDLETNKGVDLSGRVDENGNFCLVGVNRSRCLDKDEFLREVSFHLRAIRFLGHHVAGSYDTCMKKNGLLFYGDTATCAFS
jgi:hypothetical protein